MKKALSLILAAILLFGVFPLSAAAAGGTVIAVPTGTASDSLTVTSKSNFFGTKTVSYQDAVPSQVIMEYYCDTDKYLFTGGQYGVIYDPAVLKLNEESNMVGEDLNVFPITNGGGVFNFGPLSYNTKYNAMGNFTHPTGYDLVDKTGKPIPVVRLVFDVVGSGSTEVELCVDAQSCSPVGDPNTNTGYFDESYHESAGHQISDMKHILTNDGAQIDTTFIPDGPTQSIINGMRVTLTEPEPGKAPDFNAVVPAGYGYAVDSEDGVMWFNVSNNDVCIAPDSGYVFEPNQEYRVVITLVTTDDAYTFAPTDRKAKLNDREVGFSDYGRNAEHMVYMKSSFVCTPESGPTVIDTVAVTVDEPVAGEKPSYTATVSAGAGYRLESYNEDCYRNGIAWLRYSDRHYLEPGVDTFEEGEEYYCYLRLTTVSGKFVFADNLSGIGATINDAEAVCTTRLSDKLISIKNSTGFTVPYSETIVIDTIEVTVDEPVAGEKVSNNVSVPAGAKYCVKTFTAGQFKCDVLWSRVSDYAFLQPDVDTFEEGEEYFCRVLLKTVSDKYVFADSEDDLSITINGRKATIDYRDSDHFIFVISEIDQHVIVPVPVPGDAYDLWLGSTKVTDDNKDDILSDGGKAKYDPETNTLTLNNPTISDVYDHRGNTYKIYTTEPNLNIKGSYHMTAADAGCAICSYDGSLTFSGNFTLMAASDGIDVWKDLSVNSGSLTVKAGGRGMKSHGDITIGSGVTSVTIESVDKGIKAGGNLVFSGGSLTVKSQEEAGVYAHEDITIGSGAISVTSGDSGIYTYDGGISIGSDVTSVDIESGKFGFFAEDNVTVSGGALTVKSQSGGIYSISGNVTLGAGVTCTIESSSRINSALDTSDGKININCDTLTVNAASYGIATNSEVVFGASVRSADITAGKDRWAIQAGTITIDPSLTVTIPADGTIGQNRYFPEYQTILSNGAEALHVVIGISAGSTVSGSFTSYLDASGIVTVQLLQSGSEKYSATATGNTGSFSIPNVADGSYTLRVSKANHVTRDYSITVSGDTAQNVKIHPKGDVNGDGKITNYDYSRVNQHTSGTKKLTDYAFLCADVNGDGKVTNFDSGKINQHASGTKKLW